MNAPRPLPLLSIVVLGLVPLARAELVTRSPFLPPQGNVISSTPTEGAPLELRGIMGEGDGLRFCIYDPARKSSIWSGINEAGYDFTVKSHDAAHETVAVELGGKTLTLAMREAKVASSGPAGLQAMQNPGPPMPGPVVSPAVTQSVVLNPTPADEAVRLQAVVDEYRKRREQRMQATQGAPFAAPAPAAATPPPVQPQQQVQPQNAQGQQRQRGQGQGQRQRGN